MAIVDDQDIVAVWTVPLQDRVHKIEFEHGTTTGKRVIKVDDLEIMRKDWMFKLVGKEAFAIGNIKCAITIEALGTFAYEYSLEVNGKTYEKFREELSRTLKTWITKVDSCDTRICLNKNTMDVWVNGYKMDTAGEFVEDGTKTHFEIGANVCYIKATSSGKRKTGFVYQLFINDKSINAANDA